MHKAFSKTALALAGVLALAILAGCKGAVATGSLTPGPGGPGGTTVFPSFDINNPPSPEFWNTIDYEHLPNLFQFANGSMVTTLADWNGTDANNHHGRRWEIEQILETYEYGVMPPYDSNLTVSLDSTSTATTAVIDLSYTGAAGTTTAKFKVTAQIPTGTMPQGGYPAVINLASGEDNDWPTALSTAGYYAEIGFDESQATDDSSDYKGIVTTLFGYDYANDPTAPGTFMAYAWTVGRIIDALELPTPAFGGKIDPNKLLITGISRWGKGAMVAGAFAQSKKGTQIAFTDVGSAGCLGPAIERFICPLGLDEQTSRLTTQTVNNIPGRSYYMEWIPDTRSIFTNSTQDTNFFTSDHSDPSMPPYAGPIMTLAQGPTSVVAVLKTDPTYSATTGFEYHPWPNEGIFLGDYWHGIQTMPEANSESPTWTDGNFKKFQDKHFGLGVDCVGGLPTRTPYGFFSTIPFDQHFLTALIAPRGVILHDGFRTIRNNPEGTFFNHLAADEVYKFFEDQDPSDYGATTTALRGSKISDFNAIKLYFITHSYPEYEMQDTVDLSSVYFGLAQKSSFSSAYWARFTAAPFPITDSRSKHDYQKLDWARPGATPLSQQVAGVPDYNWNQITEWE
jgi:hypothetical protein